MTNKFNRKDPLCKKVYDWEDGQLLAGNELLTYTALRAMIQKACKKYKVAVAKIVTLPKKVWTSAYDPNTQTIGLVPCHKNPIVALHEVAHHICDAHLGMYRVPHSAEWFSIYCWLLLHFKVYERKFLRGSLAAYKLTLRPRGPEKIL